MPEDKDNGYLAYQDMLNGDKVDKEKREKTWLEKGITHKDFSWKGEGNSGYATVYFKDGIPDMIYWYSWDISDDKMVSNLSNDLGMEVGIKDCMGGNGHSSARIVVK